MIDHFEALIPTLANGAQLFYVVGNSKFYDAVLPVEELYADMMKGAGLRSVAIHKIRKRNSKKELFELVVTGSHGRKGRSFVFDHSARTSAQQVSLGF